MGLEMQEWHSPHLVGRSASQSQMSLQWCPAIPLSRDKKGHEEAKAPTSSARPHPVPMKKKEFPSLVYVIHQQEHGCPWRAFL